MNVPATLDEERWYRAVHLVEAAGLRAPSRLKRLAGGAFSLQAPRQCEEFIAAGNFDPDVVVATRRNASENIINKLGRYKRPGAIAGR